jgi:hypothetical protein
MTSLVDRLLPEALWQRIQPLLPAPPLRSRGGVLRRVPDRNWVAALSVMARTPTPGRCCRPRSWAAARPPPAGGAWMSGQGGRVRPAPGAGAGPTGGGRPDRPGTGQGGLLQPAGGQRRDLTGAHPADRGKAGSSCTWPATLGGLPISVVLSAANTGDAAMFEAVVDDSPAIRTPTGRRRRRPAKVHADPAYDHRRCRADLRRRGLRSRLAAAGSSRRRGLAGIAGRSSAPAPGLVAGGGCDPLCARRRTLLCPGAAGPLDHLLQPTPAATMMSAPDCPRRQPAGCLPVTRYIPELGSWGRWLLLSLRDR